MHNHHQIISGRNKMAFSLVSNTVCHEKIIKYLGSRTADYGKIISDHGAMAADHEKMISDHRKIVSDRSNTSSESKRFNYKNQCLILKMLDYEKQITGK